MFHTLFMGNSTGMGVRGFKRNSKDVGIGFEEELLTLNEAVNESDVEEKNFKERVINYHHDSDDEEELQIIVGSDYAQCNQLNLLKKF